MKVVLGPLFALIAVCSALSTSFGIAREGPRPEPGISYAIPSNLPVPVTARLVCHLVADDPSAAQATVLGVDGGTSVEVNGTDYWFFGDTFRRGPAGRRDVIPAGFAISADFDGRDCLQLTFKTASDGIVQPMFPRGDETTAWPDGVLPLPDGSILFYMVKTYRQSPTQWGVGSIGLGVLPAGSKDGVRLVERLWDAHSGFRGAPLGVLSPTRLGDDVLVYINTDAGNYLGRAPLARLGDVTAYTYWDGSGWSASPQAARPLWPVEPSTLPNDNGLSVTFDRRTGKWLAAYDAGLSSVEVRLADHPWGPWSTPIEWFDCRAFDTQQYPYCYSSTLHPELSRDGGSTIYVTFSTPQPYDVALVELHLGTAIHGWVGADGTIRYAPARPDPADRDAGTAFYASDVELPGLVPVYEEPSGDGFRYTRTPAVAGARPVFFAYAVPPSGAIHTMPVYRWQRDGREILDPADRSGWTRADVAFYVPCIDVASGAGGTECAP